MSFAASTDIVRVHNFTVQSEAMTFSAELFITVSQLIVGSVLFESFGLQFIAVYDEVFLGHAELRGINANR